MVTQEEIKAYQSLTRTVIRFQSRYFMSLAHVAEIAGLSRTQLRDLLVSDWGWLGRTPRRRFRITSAGRSHGLVFNAASGRVPSHLRLVLLPLTQVDYVLRRIEREVYEPLLQSRAA
jgi:hypothetical protein